jgi:predicted RNA binding protein YcfA (HicA-like mRNA interferase family)
MKVREVMFVPKTHGFRLARQKGSHRRFVGVVDGQTQYVTVAGMGNDDVSRKTLASIRPQPGLPVDLFR